MSRSRQRKPRRAVSSRVQQLPFAQHKNPYPPLELASTEQIELIHEKSLVVLEEIGVNFLLPEARAYLKTAGADVNDETSRVRFDRDLIEESLASAPSEFTIHARNPAHSLKFGGNHINFSAVSSPPNCSDLDNGRRTGNFEDFCKFLKLGQSFNVSQVISGHPVEPIDLPTPVRHLDAGRATIELTDKIFRGYSLSQQRVLDTIELARIARGIDEATLKREPSNFTIINANSPLQFDRPMLWA